MARVKTSRGFCPDCISNVKIEKFSSVNHILHLLLSIITFGVWIIVWIILSLGSDTRWRCAQCGNLANPGKKSEKAIENIKVKRDPNYYR